MSQTYWEEAVDLALQEVGIHLTLKQIESVGASVEVSHDNYGMSRGHDCIPNPLQSEVGRLERRIEEVRKESEESLQRQLEEKDETIRYLRRELRDLREKLESSR